MAQLVTFLTFTSGSVLDVCMVKDRELVRKCVVKYCHFSPHKLIDVLVNVPRQRHKPTIMPSRSFGRVNIAALNHYLLLIDWDGMYNDETVIDHWHAFLTRF